jgi:hypothetical protein
LKKLLPALLIIIATLPTYAGTVSGTLQGPSGIPVKNGTLTFTLQQAGLINGTGSIAQLSSQCWTDANGNIVGAPNPTVLPNMAANYGSGTLPSGIYYVVYTFLTASGQSAPSPEARIQLTSAGSIVIQPPASIPANVTGIDIYIGTTSGGETVQGTQSTNAVFTQSTPLSAGSAPPTGNATICSIAFNDTIIPYQGYNVSLTSSSGNAYPGWPQAWQLNGGTSGTVNVSQGAPLWNGVTIFPAPIFSQPLNHGPQSISGNLDFGGYNVTNIGTLTAGTTSSVVNASLQPGTDIGAQVNSAIQVCGNQCTVYVPAGTYSFTTPIAIPIGFFSHLLLNFDKGASLTYNGTGCAITANLSQVAGPQVANLRISGGQLYAGSIGSPTCGIHVMASNAVWITDMLIYGFSAGQGVWLDGVNGAWVLDSIIDNNLVGVFATNTICSGNVCSPTQTGTVYTPNAIHIKDDVITGNIDWGVQFYDEFTNASEGAENDSVEDSDLELNGFTGGAGFGAISAGMSRGLVISGDYFEGSPLPISLGIAGGNDGTNRFFASVMPLIKSNHFTLGGTAAPAGISINLLDADYAIIEGNETLGASENSGSCFVNSLARAGSNIGETHTYLSQNDWQPDENTSAGNYTCVAGASSVLLGVGSFPILNTNYIPYLAYLNFAANAALTTENIAIQYLTTNGGTCSLYPISAAARASFAAQTSYLDPITVANQVTFVHPATAAMNFNIYCNRSTQ